MSRCQHCGQGSITKDINGPVCADCWEEGRYETANPMTNQIENLTALRDAVEAGDKAAVRLAVSNLMGNNVSFYLVQQAFNYQSTDAALQWLAAVLPDYGWIGGVYPSGAVAGVLPMDQSLPVEEAHHKTCFATALILAGLNAKIAQLQKEQDDE